MKNIKRIALIAYGLFLLVSLMIGYQPGKEIGHNLFTFAVVMIQILPCAFLLIGLFEAWVKRETVERHLGKDSGPLCYLWATLLASTTVGGVYVAFPLAYSLFRKGAKLSVLFTYISAAAVCRIPMTIFEASFMGIKFTAIRILISFPLVLLSSIWLGNYLESKNYQIVEGG